MKNEKQNGKKLLLFLALFGFAVGLFENFIDLWMVENGLSSISVSNVKSLSYIVTVLLLFFFTIKYSNEKLKRGMIVTLFVKIIVDITLIFLNGTGHSFEIKFLIFFDIASTRLILSSIYPLMMRIDKNDIIYTKKGFIESLSNKLGFLLVSILLGKVIFGNVFDYNASLLLSTVIMVISLIVLFGVKIDNKKEQNRFDIKKTLNYFSKNKTLYLYLAENILGSIIWSSILGMQLLTLTTNLNVPLTVATFLILVLGVISNFLSMIVVKHLNFKNDHINMFFKYGIRMVLYALTFLTGSSLMLFMTALLLLLTECIYGFIFGSFFINNIDEKYTLVLTTLKYCTALIGDAIGVFFCGLVFNSGVRIIILPALVVAIIHYILGTILIEKKKSFKQT